MHSNSRSTWNLCHPVNIYIFKNGITGVPATLVHIPAEKKRNMSSVLESIQTRLKLPVGYPEKLYYINGIRVCRTSELQMYEEYVVVTNLDKTFRCAEYGRPRSPLVVTGRYSRHARNINVNEQNFNIFNIKRRKNEDKKSKFGYAYKFVKDGFGPSELSYLSKSSRECGSLCQNIKRHVDCKRPDMCSPIQPPTTPQCYEHQYKRKCDTLPRTNEMGVNTKDLGEYQESNVNSEHLLAFINRYRDIGGQLYKMFHDRLNGDSQKLHHDHCNPDHTWYSEHLFEMFTHRMDERSGKESGTNSSKNNSNYTPDSVSKTSAKTLEFDKMSDGRTGARAAASSSPTVKHYPPLMDPGAQKSLSSLMQERSAPTGTTKPKPKHISNSTHNF